MESGVCKIQRDKAKIYSYERELGSTAKKNTIFEMLWYENKQIKNILKNKQLASMVVPLFYPNDEG